MAPKTAAAPKPTGPKYGDMAKEAILALKDRTGSSLPAIKKWLATNYPKATNDAALKAALKFAVSKGTFLKVKASYKVSPEAKKPPKKPKKKAAPKKKTTTKKKPAKKTTDGEKKPKKTAAKKKTATKKKPAAKKTAKPAAKKPAAKKTAAKPKKAIAKKKASPKKK